MKLVIKHLVKYNFIFVCLFFAFVSCEKDLDTRIEVSPKLCFNCILNPDSLIKGSLSLSRSISEAGAFVKINHATVELKKDGQFIGLMQNTGNGIYGLTFKPCSGSIYELTIKAEGFPELHASTKVPEKPSVSCLLNDSVRIYGYTNYLTTYTIHDRLGENHYWQFKIENRFGRKEFVVYHYDINSVIIDDFNKVTDATDKLGFHYEYYLRINDNGLDGKILTYTDLTHPKDCISFMDTDVHYDKYMKSSIKQKVNEYNSTFSEPVQIYTNIENGLGIFGSAAITSFKL